MRAACENCIADNSKSYARTVTASSSETSSYSALAEENTRRHASGDTREMNAQREDSRLYSLDSRGLLNGSSGVSQGVSERDCNRN